MGETCVPSRTLVLVPAALGKPGWQHGRATLTGIFLHSVISPPSQFGTLSHRRGDGAGAQSPWK